MEQEKKEIENELAELRKELIDICNEIRDCKNKEIRAQLFEEKKLIQEDIEFLNEQAQRFEKLMKDVEDFDKNESK